MHGLGKVTAALAAATILLAGCGGGGGGASVPAQGTTTGSSAANHAVGTAKLTLALPKVITATRSGKTVAVRAIPHGASRALPRGTVRSPQYINASPNPGNGPCPGGDNYIDLYVNGTLLTNLDGQGETSDSVCVQATADSTQTVSLPLYSDTASQIVAIEWDATGTYVLSLGETDYGSFSPGSSIPITLTMLMNVYDIGITNLSFSDPELMENQPYGDFDFTCTLGLGSSSQFGLYATDALGDFVPVAGYGGTSTPTATGISDYSGTTAIAQTSIPGIYTVAWDNNCDSISTTATATNPAYAIYNDVANGANVSAYPGIADLYDNDINNVHTWFSNQLNYNSTQGSVDIQNDTD